MDLQQNERTKMKCDFCGNEDAEYRTAFDDPICRDCLEERCYYLGKPQYLNDNPPKEAIQWEG